jgi:hypothetical protein
MYKPELLERSVTKQGYYSLNLHSNEMNRTKNLGLSFMGKKEGFLSQMLRK